VGLEIHQALRFSAHVELVGASSVSSNHGKYVFARYVEGLPYVDESGFVPALSRLAESAGVDLIIPAHDSVVLELARRQAELPCPVIGSPQETCEICRSKGDTYERLGGLVRTPAVFKRTDAQVEFPVFLKPDAGQGSEGTRLAESRDELEAHVERNPSLLILEYLPGPEYTVDCFTDRHGALRFVGARERVRTRGGISVDTRPVREAAFDDFAHRINATLALRGPWFFQVKRDSRDELALLEVAPRASGGMGLYRNLGVNFALLGVYDALGQDVEILAQDHAIEMDRALCNRFRIDVHYDHVYFDLDDTLLVGGAVNPLAAAFLYQCRNRGVRVHLVSRHAGDLQDTLARCALDGLFDSVVKLDDLACKSGSMTAGKAIFIDDSYAERKRVHETLGIPTFAVDALECLLDWRR